MTTWAEFVEATPELAACGAERFEGPSFIYLGSTLVDGWPRITPVELLISDGELYLGMMWQSMKALNLLRDPRSLLHSAITDRMGSEGEFKLRGRAVDVTDEDERKRYGVALEAKIGWRPGDTPFHLFAVDIVDVAQITRDGPEVDNPQQHVGVWAPQ
ncbi:MAG TPA: pyridoxamine 5'-phosphate oxidase family protein [Dehalococcoidia bacterium]|nr:pyridoxamine 5'-phosphate oxidase family protein [Dehalococcoidia bacterium]